MASTHIEITGSSNRLNGELRRLIDQVHRLQDEMRHTKAVMDSSSLGSDWAGLEAAYALPAGQGQTVYNLVVDAAVKLNSADVDAFTSKLG